LFNIVENVTVEAIFVLESQEITYSITLGDMTNGDLTTSDPYENVSVGTNVTFTVVPAEGYELDKILIDGEEVNLSDLNIDENNQFTVTVTKNITLTATFKKVID
jgi:hypothetical protein